MLCFLQPVFAETYTTTRVERLSLEEGLSQASIRGVLQDKKGFLWIATQDGLNRYDGYEFKVYKNDIDDPTTISDNWQTYLHEDRNGNLWVGTYHTGLNLFDPTTEQFTHFRHNENDPHSLSDDKVWAIHEDHNGFIWVGTRTGLNKLDPTTKKFTHFRHDKNNPYSLSDNKVWAIHEDKMNNIWVGTYSNGLSKFNPSTGKFTHFQHDKNNTNSLMHNSIRAIYEDNAGILWIGTLGGLEKFDPVTEQFKHFRHNSGESDQLSHDQVYTISGGQNGVLWLGTFGGGLNKFDPNTESFNHYRHDVADLHSLSADNILCVIEDSTGIIWAGTKGAGLNKLNPSSSNFQHFKARKDDPYSLSANSVWAIHAANNGVVWIGTSSDGLSRYDPVTQYFSLFRHNDEDPNSISLNAITSISQDSAQRLWVGTFNGGLNQFDPISESFRHFRHEDNELNSLSSDYVWFTYEDKAGNFWIGTSGGLDRYDRKTEQFNHFVHDKNNNHSISNNTVRAVSEGAKGILWLATYGGLNKFDPTTKRFTHYIHNATNVNSLANDRISTVYVDKTGMVWIGLAGGGLDTFDPKKELFTHYREKQGLANNYIYGILEDNFGYIWLSTNKGLSKFDRTKLTFKNYTIYDGLQSDEFNMAHSKGNNGELFFGGINGFNRFFPEKIKDDMQAPIVVITDFLLFNKSVPLKARDPESPLDVTIAETKALTLNYQQSIFSFEFSALHFLGSKHNQYAYKLEGFDENWRETGANKRFATYTHAPAGEYIFRVKASNQNGVWNNVGASIKITILPPPWQTWWAYFLYLLIIVGSITKYIYYQASKQKYLETLVSNRTKELTKLTAAVEQSPTSVTIANLDGIIEYVNPKFCQVTGYCEAEAIGKNVLFIASEQHLSEYGDVLRQTLRSGQEWRGEFLNKKKNGVLFWESSLLSPIYSNDGIISHFLSVREDITDRKNMEIQLKQAKDTAENAMRIAESAAQAKANFLANMSHEIRTPMNAIIGISHLALQTPLNPKQQDYINKINIAANSLLGIINDILDFSKIEAGKMDIEFIPFSLNETLDDLAQLVMGKIQDQGLELLIDIGADVPEGLIGDPLRLRQILLNLINNAIKFTHDGEIIIRITRKALTKEQVVLQFSIIDSGIGMTKEQMDKLFQSFSQADTSTTRKYGGTGLGLTISKTLTEMMGGKIWVESTVGVGSTFGFTANFGVSEKTTLISSQQKLDLHGLYILIVDDSASAREIMQYLAQSLSFNAEVVASGEEALEHIQYADKINKPFSIVFMDWKMPRMDGVDACYHIKSDASLRHPPKVVMVTAYNKDDMLKHLKGKYFDGFLSKPISASSLLDVVMTIRGHKQTQSNKSIYELELEAVASIRGARILLVDDNEVNQQVGAELLELAQMVVTTADDGQSAVEKVEEEDFDLVLMDIQMPIMDGYAATKEIRKNPKYKTLPIIAMTANAMSTDRDKCLQAGMNEHIAKPIDPNLLYRTLAQWIKPRKQDIELTPLLSTLPQPSNLDDENKKMAALSLALPGVEVEQAVIGIGGSLNAYRKVLNKVVTAESDAMDRLQDSLDNDDHEASIRIAHSLKGVAGSIGAKSLQMITTDLETALINKEKEKQQILLAETKKVFNETMMMIQSALATEKEKSLKKNNIIKNKAITQNKAMLNSTRLNHATLNADVIAALKELLVLIDNCDAMSEEAVETLLEKIQEQAIYQLLTQLQHYLAQYDFDSAAKMLTTLLMQYDDK